MDFKFSEKTKDPNYFGLALLLKPIQSEEFVDDSDPDARSLFSLDGWELRPIFSDAY